MKCSNCNETQFKAKCSIWSGTIYKIARDKSVILSPPITYRQFPKYKSAVCPSKGKRKNQSFIISYCKEEEEKWQPYTRIWSTSMSIDKVLHLRQELIYGSSFRLTKRIVPNKLTWIVSCLPASTNALDLTGTKRLHSRVEIGQRGGRDIKLSSEILGVMDDNGTVKEDTQATYRDRKLSSEILGVMDDNGTGKEDTQATYDAAMDALSSLISRKKRGEKSNKRDEKFTKLERMSMYVKILDLEEHISGLKIIHVAGTKGKGSTCAFCEAILRESGFRTGLFTSPHLIDVRERFRLDGLDISKEKFLHYFYECWHQLKENVTDDLPMPPLFQFLTVLALKIFASEKVDVAIIEVGLGGTTDSTNVIKDPVVCGVSPLGMDHVETLGNTLGQIASHKAGIFKPQVPAFTVPQLPEAMDALEERANELTVPLKVVAPLEAKNLKGTRLSLSGDHQFTNAGLAVALCKSWLKRTGYWEKLFQQADEEDSLPEAFLRGLSTARLSGRAQIVDDSPLSSSNATAQVNGISSGELIFYLDGAHSPESMEACARWFSSAVKDGQNQSSVPSFLSKLQSSEKGWSNGVVQPLKNDSGKISKQILLFNCMDVRDPEILLPTLVDTCASSGTYFSKAIFVPSISTYSKVTSGSSVVPLDGNSKDLKWQFNLQRIWEKITHGRDMACKNMEMEIPASTPPQRFIHEDTSNCSPAKGHFKCSAVVSSLPLTINWLRNYAKENPSLKIQVLVTGSLHMVGDVLKLLRR